MVDETTTDRPDFAGAEPLPQANQQAPQDQQPQQPPRQLDRQWPNRDPLIIPVSQERLREPHQKVAITNNSHVEGWPSATDRPRPQTHIVIDRFQQGIEIRAGETKRDVDLLKRDIEYFLKQRQPRKDQFGRFRPLHPLSLDVRAPEREQPPVQQRQLDEDDQPAPQRRQLRNSDARRSTT